MTVPCSLPFSVLWKCPWNREHWFPHWHTHLPESLNAQHRSTATRSTFRNMSIFSLPGHPTRHQCSSLLLVRQTLCHGYTMHTSFLALVFIIVLVRNTTALSPLHDPAISPWVPSAHSFYSVFSYFIYSLTTKVMSQNTHCSELLKLFLIVSLTRHSMLESIENINERSWKDGLMIKINYSYRGSRFDSWHPYGNAWPE